MPRPRQYGMPINAGLPTYLGTGGVLEGPIMPGGRPPIIIIMSSSGSTS